MNWHKTHMNKLSLGQRAADKIRNWMGSWVFVFAALIFLAVWMYTRGAGVDTFPYILLNLVLSCLAALQGAILLIAAKRQDEISQALAQHDYEVNIESEKRIEALQRKLAEIEIEKLDKILEKL